MSSITTILGALTGLAALGSVYIFWRKRQTIPKLSFDGYWKSDSLFMKGHVETKVTSYCVRIEDINSKREGQIRWCAGAVTVNDSEYKTIWMFTNKRHHNFAKEAWLKLFDVDWKEETIGLFNTLEESKAKRSPVSYERLISNNITMVLEAARGRCQEPLNEKIEYIIKNAQYFKMHSLLSSYFRFRSQYHLSQRGFYVREEETKKRSRLLIVALLPISYGMPELTKLAILIGFTI